MSREPRPDDLMDYVDPFTRFGGAVFEGPEGTVIEFSPNVVTASLRFPVLVSLGLFALFGGGFFLILESGWIAGRNAGRGLGFLVASALALLLWGRQERPMQVSIKLASGRALVEWHNGDILVRQARFLACFVRKIRRVDRGHGPIEIRHGWYRRVRFPDAGSDSANAYALKLITDWFRAFDRREDVIADFAPSRKTRSPTMPPA